MTNIDNERAKFEAWAKEEMPHLSLLWHRSTEHRLGCYNYAETRQTWEGWLARAQSGKAVSVEALEALASAVERGGSAVRHMGRMGRLAAGVRSDVAASIRALIAKETGNG